MRKVSKVALRSVAEADLQELRIINKQLGGDFLPFPLLYELFTTPVSYDVYASRVSSVMDRFNNGDLQVLTEWFSSYRMADLRVECQVFDEHLDGPLLIVAHRSGQHGFFAAQRPTGNLVDIYALSPYDIGVSIAQASPLTKAGGHLKAVIGSPPRSVDNRGGDVTVRNEVVRSTAVTIPEADISAYGRVQSRWRPAQERGFDEDKPSVRWYRVKNDGDYITAVDSSHLVPVTKRSLGRRIDALIADDVRAVRQSQGR